MMPSFPRLFVRLLACGALVAMSCRRLSRARRLRALAAVGVPDFTGLVSLVGRGVRSPCARRGRDARHRVHRHEPLRQPRSVESGHSLMPLTRAAGGSGPSGPPCSPGRLPDRLGLRGAVRRFPPYGNYSTAMVLFNRILGVRNGQRAHQSVAEILRERHLHPNAVFITHLHPDHTSGVADLPADVDYVFGRQEAGFLARVAVGSHFSGKPRLRTLDYAGVAPMPPLGPALDLLGDGSLWAISTPGHTPDHTSYLVNGNPPTLLVGDASHFAWAFERDVAPRAFTSGDRARAVESLTGSAGLPFVIRRSTSCSGTRSRHVRLRDSDVSTARRRARKRRRGDLGGSADGRPSA